MLGKQMFKENNPYQHKQFNQNIYIRGIHMYHFDINKYKRTALKNKCIKIREHLTYNISNEMNVHRRKCFKVRTLQAKHDKERRLI